jgi:very-short-patch-repair endonuclease
VKDERLGHYGKSGGIQPARSVEVEAMSEDLARYRADLSGRSEPEETLAGQLRARSLSDDPLPEPLRQFRFDVGRKWRFDFAWPLLMVALEVDGGSWSGGRHTRGAGFEADCEKLSVAASYGWKVLRCTTKQVESGIALVWVERALQGGK